MDSEIIGLIRKAQLIASKELGIQNILQPGIIKEMIIADILGHTLIPQKALPDAKDGAGNFYEYLSSINRKNESNFQIDRITKKNLYRIKRNAAFFFAFFKDQLTVEEIYQVETKDVLKETMRQINASKNQITHINLSPSWIKSKGRKIYPK
jgi:hypothetical protein